MINGQTPPEETGPEETVEVTLEIGRKGWEALQTFGTRYGIDPLDLLSQAVIDRARLLAWLLDREFRRAVS